MKQDNFYTVLGVNETSSQDEIKKAYRKLAFEHHPDKGGSEETFKKISEAYETIGDEKKRSDYDRQRKNPFANHGGGDPFKEYEDFIKGFTQRKRSAPDKIIEIDVTVLDSFNSSDKTITYERKHACDTCEGKGGDKIKCSTCNGVGFTQVTMGTGYFQQVFRQPCNMCRGEGEVFKTKCGTCSGSGTKTETESIKIKLPHGVDEGQFFKMQGKGDFYGGIYGNLIIKVKVIPENNFEKNFNDLIYNAYFNLDDLKKDTFEIPHPMGKLNIKLPNDFDTSKPLRVKSKGFSGGDLFIKLNVKFKRND